MNCRAVGVRGLNWLVPEHRAAAGARPVVLIHGAGGSSRHWRWVSRALPPGIIPLAVDLPGHGESPGEVPGTLALAAARVQDGIAELCGAGPVAVAGHSVGGLVALLLAMTGPQRVSHLALIGTAARIAPHPGLLGQLRRGEPDEAFLRAGFSAGVREERVQLVLSDLRRTRLAPGAGDFMGISGRDLSPELPQVTAETLVLIARRDPVVSPRKSRALAAGISGARAVVLDGGHYLTIERPQDVAAHLARLLDARPPGPEPAVARSEATRKGGRA